MFVENAEYPAYALIAYAGAELTVGKRSGSALAELNIAFGVELSARSEGIYLLFSRFGISAALEDDGSQSRHAQHQRREHSGRAEAGYDRARIRAALGDKVLSFFVQSKVFAPAFCRYPILVVYIDRNGIQPVYIVFPPCIERTLYNFKAPYRPSGHAHFTRSLCSELILALTDIEPQVSYKYHFPSLPAVTPLAHAHWRLKPPQSASTSSSSPVMNRCGTNQLSSVSGFTPVVFMPPAVTCA